MVYRGSGIVLLAFAVSGCWGDEKTRFPEGLDPIETIDVAAPPAVGGDLFPEMLAFDSGNRMGFDWVEARGFVHAPIARTWEAMREPEVCVDRREVDRWALRNATDEDLELYDFAYVIHNEVDDVINVEFDNTWHHGATMGTVEEPEEIVANFQKTWGTTFIDILRGTIIARPVDAETTELLMVEHIRAASGDGQDQARSYLTDYHASIVAHVHGEPLPAY
jgi:hypothetical protein